jgi:hypothetical protein
MSYKLVSSLAVSVALAIPALSQAEGYSTDNVITDRPDFTESAVVVPVGTMQFEGGFTLEQWPNDLSVFSLPELLIRKSMSETIELRIGVPSYTKISNGFDLSGIGDASIGAKFELGRSQSGIDLAAIASLSLPIGKDGLTSDEPDPSFALVAGKTLDERWSFGAQIMAGWLASDFNWGATAVVGASLGGTWGGFFELATDGLSGSGSTSTIAHTGLTYVLKSGVQLDYHVGFGLSDAAPDVLFGAGLSFRR